MSKRHGRGGLQSGGETGKKGVIRAEGGEPNVSKVSDVREHPTLELCSPRPARRDRRGFSTSTAGQSLRESRFLKVILTLYIP